MTLEPFRRRTRPWVNVAVNLTTEHERDIVRDPDRRWEAQAR
jgi:hypothetical protein